MRIKNTDKSRRNFIKSGLTGVTAALLSPGFLNKKIHIKKDKFVYRTLGRTGLKLPVVSIGGPGSPSLINYALDKGIIHINTSPEYQRGNQEIMIGKTLKNRSRDSFFIGTGFSMWRKPRNQITHYNKKMIIKSFEESLRRLNLDYVDIYYLGSAGRRETVLYEPYLELYDRLKQSGKTRFVGVITHDNEPEVIRAAAGSGGWDIVLTEVRNVWHICPRLCITGWRW